MNVSMQLAYLKKTSFWFYSTLSVFGLLYLTLAVANHYFFRTYTFDYGVFNNDYWNLAHFHLGNNPLYHTHNYLNVNTLKIHFTAVLIYLWPFYWLLNWLTGTYTLLILQELLVVAAGWAVYKLVKLKTGNGWLGVLALLYYFVLQGHYASFSLDFNEAIVCACLLPLFLYAFESGNLKTAAALFFLSLFGREDMPLYFIFIFAALMLWHRKERKTVRLCLYGIGIALLYFVLVFTVFIPLTHSNGYHYNLFEYSALGKTPGAALLGIVTNPIQALELLFVNHSGKPEYNWCKAEFYLVYLASGAFFALYRPRYFIWFIPMLAQKMYNDDFIRWGIEGYYSIFVVTLLPVSVFMAISEIYSALRARITAGIAVCLMAGSVTWFVENDYVHAISWISTVKENIFSYNFNHPGYNAPKLHSLLDTVPPDSAVCASASLVPQLAQRSRIYLFPYKYDVSYMAIFAYPDNYEVPPADYADSILHLVHSHQWNLVAAYYPLLIFRKEPNTLAAEDIFGSRKPDEPPDNITTALMATPLRVLVAASDTVWFDKKDFPRQYLRSFSCDCETLAADGKSPVASDGTVMISEGVTSEKKHSGNYSIRLTPDKPYGMNRKLGNLQGGDVLCASIWRYSPEGKGCMVLCSDNNTIFYTSGNNVKTDSSGWQRMQLSVIIPLNCPELKFYAWSGKDTAYFDDLKVDIYKRKR